MRFYTNKQRSHADKGIACFNKLFESLPRLSAEQCILKSENIAELFIYNWRKLCCIIYCRKVISKKISGATCKKVKLDFGLQKSCVFDVSLDFVPRETFCIFRPLLLIDKSRNR